jgi:hypothetical protein
LRTCAVASCFDDRLAAFFSSWGSAGPCLGTHPPVASLGLPLELELGVALPVAEGVVPSRARFIPAMELTFNVYDSVRYLWYPVAQDGMSVGQALGTRFSNLIVGGT